MWLLEPLVGDTGDSEASVVTREAESLSMVFLLLLERLGPVERAALLLHEVFDYGYDEIARIVGKSETNCRQLAAHPKTLAARFFTGVASGDLDRLVKLLSVDICPHEVRSISQSPRLHHAECLTQHLRCRPEKYDRISCGRNLHRPGVVERHCRVVVVRRAVHAGVAAVGFGFGIDHAVALSDIVSCRLGVQPRV
jgi:hypothetical protein